MEPECCKCGGPADPECADGLYDLCAICSADWEEFRLTPFEEEELFRDSDISLAEWEYLIVHGPED